MTRQAIVLGWLPRLRVSQTSQEGYGQIYIGAVNWLLMIATLGVTLGFGKSDNLASAYGIAVSLTMLITGVLLFIAMQEIWHWPLLGAGAVAIIFVAVDSSFVLANMAKVRDGGYVPLLLAAAVFAIMWTWHRGMSAVNARTIARQIPLKTFMQRLDSHPVARVPGSAVFLTRSGGETPLVMEWQVKQNRSLHEYVLVLTIAVASTPRVALRTGVSVQREADKFWRAEARYGFMETPDVLKILRECNAKGAEIDLDDVTFYVGRATILPQEGRGGIPRWQEAVFAAMERNALRITDVLRLPHDQVVEIGREIAI
jgi:KUP system potassium uptake protein